MFILTKHFLFTLFLILSLCRALLRAGPHQTNDKKKKLDGFKIHIAHVKLCVEATDLRFCSTEVKLAVTSCATAWGTDDFHLTACWTDQQAFFLALHGCIIAILHYYLLINVSVASCCSCSSIVIWNLCIYCLLCPVICNLSMFIRINAWKHFYKHYLLYYISAITSLGGVSSVRSHIIPHLASVE